jgi:hypothetical protein
MVAESEIFQLANGGSDKLPMASSPIHWMWNGWVSL